MFISDSTCVGLPVEPTPSSFPPKHTVMSANEEKDAVFRAIRAGAQEYLIKPITKKEVANIWQHVWRRLSSAAAFARSSGSEVRDTVRVGLQVLWWDRWGG